MSFYFDVALSGGAKGIARVFVKPNGTDELQIAYHKPGKPEVQWSSRHPGAGWSVYKLSAASAFEWCRGANARWLIEAERLTAKAAVR